MESKNNNTNFWISYADLMAGLLFVFILLIGAIIVKYSLLQSESKVLEKSLENEKIALEKNKKELKEKEEKIKNVVDDLKNTKKEFETTKKQLKESILKNEQLNVLLDVNTKKAKEQKEELESLKLVKDDIEKKLKASLKLEEELKINIKDLETQNLQKDEKLNSLLEEVLLKKAMIKSFEEKSKLLNDEIKVMEEQLKNSKEKHDALTKDLENTKEKIKSFTGIKVKVISLLKSKLGNSIQIDPKNGSLRLSSKILFDEGEFELKDSSKQALKNAVYDYFKTILENEEINKHIDKIIIEGHTNSKGTYLYNLELSQKRAYSVMQFLLSLDLNDKGNLKKMISASGRAFLDPIFDKKGKEDSEASRRIEIKLSLKNEEAIKEIGKLLQ